MSNRQRQKHIERDRNDKEECRFCKPKQKLVEGRDTYCINHSVKNTLKSVQYHLQDYLPTSRELNVKIS